MRVTQILNDCNHLNQGTNISGKNNIHAQLLNAEGEHEIVD